DIKAKSLIQLRSSASRGSVAVNELVTSNRASSLMVAYPEMLAAAGGPWYGEARCCAVVAFSSHASICGDIFISWGTRFSPYGDRVNLSRCFYCPAILTLD